ncbi:MAG TPA: ribonuclease III [bacterium]|nr:ribonuclease III [bacterium]
MSLSLFKNLIPKKKLTTGDESGWDKARLDQLKKFSKSLKVPLGGGRHLNEALTHKSYAHERKMDPRHNNEKLEFLGDSVLGLIISQHVFESYPDVTEGGLSKVKSVIVSAQVLSEKAKLLNLGDYLQLGKGEEKSGGRSRPALLADALEAVIGAIYLESGLDAARKVVLNLLREDVDHVFSGRMEKDYKTLLQEHFQKTQKIAPRYEIIREWGPDHNRNFETVCRLNGKVLSTGIGKNKKEAEQLAAQEAIRKLGITVSTPSDHRIG